MKKYGSEDYYAEGKLMQNTRIYLHDTYAEIDIKDHTGSVITFKVQKTPQAIFDGLEEAYKQIKAEVDSNQEFQKRVYEQFGKLRGRIPLKQYDTGYTEFHEEYIVMHKRLGKIIVERVEGNDPTMDAVEVKYVIIICNSQTGYLHDCTKETINGGLSQMDDLAEDILKTVDLHKWLVGDKYDQMDYFEVISKFRSYLKNQFRSKGVKPPNMKRASGLSLDITNDSEQFHYLTEEQQNVMQGLDFGKDNYYSFDVDYLRHLLRKWNV
jgi:hypothetical protein